MTQPEALRLAAHAEANSNFGDMKSIAAELRRLHEVNQELLAALKVAALAIHQSRTLGAPHAYWDDVEYQAAEAIAKGEAK
jgi:hypothetical protein